MDNPTERRVRRWAFSIEELIKDPIGRKVLESFLESEFSQENIRFWLAVQDIKYCPRSHVEEKVDEIHQYGFSLAFSRFYWLFAAAAWVGCQLHCDLRELSLLLEFS